MTSVRARRLAPGMRLVALAAALSMAAVAGAQSPPADNGTADTESAPAAPPAAAAVVAAPLGLLLADSELVYGPTLYGFDVEAFVAGHDGYLAAYRESIEGEELSGAAIVRRVAEDFSVGPRVLLALIEAHSGWVTRPEPEQRAFAVDEPVAGLRDGLVMAADALNTAYYAHRLQERRSIVLSDGTELAVPDTNPGTFAVLAVTWRGATAATWGGMSGPSRFHAAWTRLFGDPSTYDVVATLPPDIPHVDLALPFPSGEVWFFTAAPHPPWGTGAAPAAIDFSPPPESAEGCHPSGASVTAVAAGRVVRSRPSGVLVDPDLDGDAFEGTGWTHVYLHLSTTGRVAAGTELAAGQFVGYPSCEGGMGGQTRLAFARRYNGEWIAAQHPPAPLILGGWMVVAGGEPGTAFLARAGLPARPAMPEKSAAQNGVAWLPEGP